MANPEINHGTGTLLGLPGWARTLVAAKAAAAKRVENCMLMLMVQTLFIDVFCGGDCSVDDEVDCDVDVDVVLRC